VDLRLLQAAVTETEAAAAAAADSSGGDGSESDLSAFSSRWAAFQRFLRVHMAMEDGGIFPLLDASFDGAVSSEGMHAEHTLDVSEAAAVQTAIDAGDIAGVRAAWAPYHTHHLEHLVHEEKVLMPLVGRLGGRDEVRRTALFNKHIVAPGLATGDFDFFVSHGVGTLAVHGSTEHDAKTATRVFANAIRGCTPPDQWAHLLPIVKAAMPPEVYEAAVALGGIDGPGLLDEEAAEAEAAAAAAAAPATGVTDRGGLVAEAAAQEEGDPAAVDDGPGPAAEVVVGAGAAAAEDGADEPMV
jgi:hypothetical protein